LGVEHGASVRPPAREVNARTRLYHPAVSCTRPVLFLLISALCCASVAKLRGQPMDHLVIVAPAAPGGGWDQTARVLQQVIERRGLARIVEVQNVPGAAGTIGLAQFVNAGSGNTQSLLITGLVMVGATLWNDSPVSIGQATPIARLTGEYEVIAVPAASAIGDMRQLVEAFRRRPEAFAWGGGSAGGTDHILAGLIAEAAGVDPRRVNYVAFSGGGEAVAALLGGHVAAGISGYSEFAPHVQSGRLRAIAISSPSRAPGIDVPTIRDSGLDVEMVNWRGVLGAGGLSTADRARLTTLVSQAAHSPEWQRVLAEREWSDLYLDGAAFEAFLASERTRFTRVVARLRGPGRGTPVMTGQRLVPLAVVIGAALVFAALVVSGNRARQVRTDTPPGNAKAVRAVALGLLVFLILLRPLGFATAASALFVLSANAFAPSSSHRQRMWTLVIAVVFVVIVTLAFTRGLDLPLPQGQWTR
jgi:putative tricarboxylic transport membrane protein